MDEDSTRTEARCSATLPANLPSSAVAAGAEVTSPTTAAAVSPDAQEPPLLIPSFSANSTPSSPGGTLKRLSMALKAGPPSPASPTSPSGGTGGQVSAITVVALLDKLVAMMETVQENQQRAERRQAELEAAVRVVQGDVTRLAKSHSGTANSVNKLLERSRKTGGHVKEVRERLDRQGVQVKRLEANHAHLLKRNHFKVLIFQEDNEIPASLHLKDPAAISIREAQEDASAHAPTPNTDANRSQEEGLQTISLTSDEEQEEVAVAAGVNLSSPRGEAGGELHLDDDDDDDGLPSLSSERLERSRADKLKRSSLKKVDSLKKAFSRQSIEKKINKIVPPERREKIKKSFTPNHAKSPTTKSSSFRVSPMTFNVKKVRDGGEAPAPEAHVEVPSLGGPSGELSLAEVHLDEKEKPPMNASASSSMEVGLSVDGEIDGEVNGEVEGIATATLAVEETMPDHNDDDEDDDDDDVEHNGEEERASPVASPASPVNAAVAVEQGS
ncbi:hypothetical protein ACEWY4_023000 [Coilia grayii]|uniref:Uncharacterized protein n=1 Tax=Coilia grayii TaxID=363190 RepID=A0ABD1J235_9TELE